MRNVLSIVVFALGCGGAQTTEPAARPSPAQGGFQAQPVAETWVNLGVPVEVSPFQAALMVNGQGGQIAQLLIKGTSGEPEIEQVTIEYMDKSVNRIDLNKRFVPGDGQVIELKSDRLIEKITITIDPDTKGTIEIFGA